MTVPRDRAAWMEAGSPFGSFTDGGRSYTVRLSYQPGQGHRMPPRPWINVLANERFGCLVSETGAGYTWSGNSREHRLTPWSNDPVTDPHSEALYLRDEETGRFWSPQPGPAPAPADYETRHEFGRSKFLLRWDGIEHETVVFVPRRDPVRITRIRLRNESERGRRLGLTFYTRLAPGANPAKGLPPLESRVDPDGARVWVFQSTALPGEPPGGTGPHATVTAGSSPVAWIAGSDDRSSGAGRAGGAASGTTDRAAFLGPEGDLAQPAALIRGGPLEGRGGAQLDPCAAVRLEVELAPGEEYQACFLLGETEGETAARELLGRHASIEAVHAAEAEVAAYWEGLINPLQVETPDPALDAMLNGWLAYQVLACRIWARSALYQSGGAFGFRDQLQDAAALVYLRPELTREQILLHAAHQFVEGDVLHWWHPPDSRGIRTRFADDLIWLPYITAFYIGVTGDREILDVPVRFLRARALSPGEDEAYLVPEASGESAALYEHCCRALDRSLVTGAHGLPLFGAGDWNDGMNRVGREGRGESVWMALFLIAAIDAFVPFARARGDLERAGRYEAFAGQMRHAVNDTGWDGAWYRRGYYDDGTPLGSASGDECRIDALVQAWAVMTGAAPPDRAQRALEAVETHLVSEEGRIVRLLAPPFADTPHDPGYIKGYAPGVRENGGQYTHAALWVVRAEAELGWRDRAMRLLEWMNPAHRTRSQAETETYGLEPYVVAADIYGVAPHLGRGGWSWYTGSAGWMYRVALETILGFHLENGDTLRLAPRVPDRWGGFRICFRLPGCGTRFAIEVESPDGCAEAVVAASLDPNGGAARACDAREAGEVDGIGGAGAGGAGVAVRARDSRPAAGGDGGVRVANGEAIVVLPRDGGRHQITVRMGRAG